MWSGEWDDCVERMGQSSTRNTKVIMAAWGALGGCLFTEVLRLEHAP